MRICFFLNLVYLTVIFYFVPCELKHSESQLSLVHLLYRHGNRTPASTYPNDPYKDIESYFPKQQGELLEEGMIGHYYLGKWLRQRYDGFLPKKYNRDDIYVLSSDVDRTIMSAYCNLAGLYSEDSETTDVPGLTLRPIPVHTIPIDRDNMISTSKSFCPKRDKATKSAQKGKITTKILNATLFDYLTKNTGMTVQSVKAVQEVFDILLTEELNNLTLPSWTKMVYPEPLRTLAVLAYAGQCMGPKLARLRGGPLIKDMVNHMSEKVKGTLSPDRKMFVYSGHDFTVGCLLQSLKVFDFHNIPYFSTVILELWKKNEEYYVKIVYRRGLENEPVVLDIPKCGKECKFEKFHSIVSPVIPEDWDKECNEK